MDVKTQMTIWVEKKLGKVISKDLTEKITNEESSFDVDSYVNDLLRKLYEEKEVENFKESLSDYFFRDQESDSSIERENTSQYSFELESQEFQTFSTEDIINNLKNNSMEVRITCLRGLELSAEDLINQTSWNTIKKTLQKMLEFNEDRKIYILVLKVFQKFLMCSNKPQLVCEGFNSLTEVISYQIKLINTENQRISLEEIYDFKKDQWLYKKVSSDQCPNNLLGKDKRAIAPDLLIRLMWLLIECQKQMPEKWIRFNQKRFREIIFSFIHLLSISTLENEELTGLELLSVINPTASWCLHWCHTATGRTLLCSALRKYKKFFIYVVEVILRHLRFKKTNQSHSVRAEKISSKPNQTNSKVEKNEKANKLVDEKQVENGRGKWIRSAPIENTHKEDRKSSKGSEWIIGSIPRRIVDQALFSHSLFLVTYLIQFRSGRSLFPLQTTLRKRLLGVQDLSLYMRDYLENLEYYEWDKNNSPLTRNYTLKVLEILEILNTVKFNIHSSRVSADRSHL